MNPFRQMNPFRELTIIIPTCNFDLLQNCIASIIQFTDFREINAEFILVPNGLPNEDRVWKFLNTLPPPFSYIWIDHRNGLCKSTNFAAKNVNAKFIGRMDDDIVLLPWARNGWIQSLLKPFDDGQVGLVAPVVFDYNEEIRKGKAVVGFCMVTRKSIWDRLGGLDEIFDPGMGEDTDFSFKVTDLGYKISLPQDGVVGDWKDGQFSGNFPIHHLSTMNYENNSNMEILYRNTEILKQRYGTKKS